MIDDLHPWTILISNDRGIVRVQEFGICLEKTDRPIELRLQVIDVGDVHTKAHTVNFYFSEERWPEIKGLVDGHLEAIRRQRTEDAERRAS
jgi:hypothetical protein